MSVAHLEQFIKRAAADATLQQRLSADAGSLEAYVALCVEEAKTMGYAFTATEATDYVKQFVETAQKGELSDVQLELVSGGKHRLGEKNWMFEGPQPTIADYFLPKPGVPAGQFGGKPKP